MTLPALKLDDLTWSDMVDAIRTRIVANSRGQWTMHGPADTGVTLLELFAYLFEQRIYWLDQVHAPLARALLALLDDAPRPTQAARTVLAFPTPGRAAPTPHRCRYVVHHHARLERAADDHARAARRAADSRSAARFARAPPAPVAVVDGRDRSAQLQTLHAVPLLGSDGGAGRFEVTLWLDRPIDAAERAGHVHAADRARRTRGLRAGVGAARRRIRCGSRACRARVMSRCPPELAIDETCGLARPSCRPPRIRTRCSATSRHNGRCATSQVATARRAGASRTARGAGYLEVRMPADAWVDGTGGLRRSGLWRIRIPADWAPSGAAVDGLVPYALRIECEQAELLRRRRC